MRGHQASSAALFLLGLCLFAPAEGLAGERTLGVLLLTPPDFEMPISDLYRAVRKTVESNTRLEVLPLDLFSESARQAAVRGCAGNARCFVERYLESGVAVDLLLTMSVARLEEELLVGVRVLNARPGVATGDLEVGGHSASSRNTLEEGLPSILSRAFPARVWGQIAGVAITSNPPGAVLGIGRETCVAPCRIEKLIPGEQELSVTKEGFEPHAVRLKLVPGETRELQIELTAVDTSTWYTSPWFWGAVAVVVVGASVSTYVATRPGDSGDIVCFWNRPEDC